MQRAIEPLTLGTGECVGAPDGICVREPGVKRVVFAIASAKSDSSDSAKSDSSDSAKSDSSDSAKSDSSDSAKSDSADFAEALKQTAAILGCNSQYCVLKHPRVRNAANIAPDLATFKVAGPRNSTAWLSNDEIDRTLELWRLEFADFYHCPFAMADFEKNGDAFAKVDLPELYRRGRRTFGCVHNTDTSAGPGDHWVAVFVDMRAPIVKPTTPVKDDTTSKGSPTSNEAISGWTIEYFNSAGRPPAAPVTRWQERARAALLQISSAVETFAVTSVAHQRSRTECGPYSLYYIRRRLEGAPISTFASDPIPDAAMIEFRRHLFRGPAE